MQLIVGKGTRGWDAPFSSEGRERKGMVPVFQDAAPESWLIPSVPGT